MPRAVDHRRGTVFVTATVLLLAMLAGCGERGRATERAPQKEVTETEATAAGAFTELAPDVYEPCGLTATTGALWVLACSGKLVRVPDGTSARTSRTLGDDIVGLDGLAGNGTDVLWALLATGKARDRRGTVLRLDPSSGQTRTSIDLGGSIPANAVFSGGTLWVAASDGALYSVDGENARRVAAGSPLMWVLADAGRVWTIAENGDVIERDAAGRAVRTFDGVILNPIGAAAGLGSVWLASGERGVVRLDPATGNVSTVGVEGTVNGIEPCGGSVWLSQPDAGLRSLDADGTVVRSVKLSVAPRYLQCMGTRLWVLSQDGRLGSIDAAT